MASKKKNDTEVKSRSAQSPFLQPIIFSLHGKKKMLEHNGRLANPLDPYSVRLAGLTGQRKKTAQQLMEIVHIEARAAMYEAPGDILGLPAANVWRSLYDAGKQFKLGEAIKRGLLQSDAVEPLLIDGRTWQCDEYLRVHGMDRILYMPAAQGKRRVMRARPVIPAGWQATFRFVLDTGVLKPSDLEPVVRYAESYVGVCDWRPRFGLFDAEIAIEDAMEEAA